MVIMVKKSLSRITLASGCERVNLNLFKDYYKYVITDEGIDKMVAMIDSLSTNQTYFFRDECHFYKLKEILSAKLASMDSIRQSAKLRKLSNGCSTGEEAFSLAMTVSE